MSDAVLTLLGVNLVVAVAFGLVMALRLPVRRLFGARVAYGLWSLVPLASLALLLPARVVRVAVSAAPQTTQMIFEPAAAATSVPSAPVLVPLAVALWIAGALFSLGHLVWRQLKFSRAARDGLAGPAVIGLLRPRIVTPFDFGRRYTPREQLVVLAHEAAHIRRHDTWANAAVALAACVNWFNPAMHLFARYLRIDQEFACDAQVMAAHPTARRSYAEAMLKTQLAARALPLGCYGRRSRRTLWRSGSNSWPAEPWNSGSIVLAAGQTGQIVLGDGQVVTVTPTVRRETPAEVEEGQRATRDMAFFGGWGSPGPRHSTDG